MYNVGSMKANGSAAIIALAEALETVVDEAVDRAADRAVEKYSGIVMREFGRVREDIRKLDSRMDGLETRMESVERRIGATVQ